MITDDELDEWYEYGFMCSIGTLWLEHYGTIERNKEVFLYKLKRWMSDGKLLLGKNGVLLDGTIDEQLALISSSFPSNEEMKEISSFWWYTDRSPANNAVWVFDRHIEGLNLKPYQDGKFLYWTA